MQEKKDRRVKYTMALLKNALIELMGEEHISKISVKELCERADVHRSTFYAHYRDPYDLLRQMEQELFDDLGRYLSVQEYEDGFPISLQKLNKILEHIKQDAGALKALLSENSDLALQRDVIQFLGFISLPIDTKNARVTEYITLFSAHGSISVINKWLQDGMLEPVEQISQFLYQILYKGMSGF